MSTVKITLEGFAGASIAETIVDAVAVARRCGCWAEIDINGIAVLISPTDNAAGMLANYEKARSRGAKFVSANVIPAGAAP